MIETLYELAAALDLAQALSGAYLDRSDVLGLGAWLAVFVLYAAGPRPEAEVVR